MISTKRLPLKNIFNRNVHDCLIGFLLLLSFVYIYNTGISVVQQLIIMPLVAALIDIGFIKIKRGKISFPRSAIITGLIMALLIPADLLLQIVLSLLAISSKHLIRIQGRNVFNPAIFALFLSSLFFLGPSWAGTATPLIVLGFFIAYKMRRLRMSVVFIAVYLIINLILNTSHLPNIYYPDFITLFFATIILVDPKTGPVKKKGMLVFAAATALLALSFSHGGVPIDPFITSLLVMNLFTRWINRI